MPSLYERLYTVQTQIPVIKKDEPNPFYKSMYATFDGIMEVVKPILNANGLAIFFPLTNIDGKEAIETLIIDHESNEIFSRVFPLMTAPDAQKQGGTITYTKRQAVCAVLAIQTSDDDDGNVASGKPVQPKAVTTPQAPKALLTPAQAATGGNERACVICGKVFTPDPRYPKSSTCSYKCSEAKKSGAKPVEHQIADQFGGHVVDALSNPDAKPTQDIELSSIPF